MARRKQQAPADQTWFEEGSGQTLFRVYRRTKPDGRIAFVFRYYVGKTPKLVERSTEEAIRQEARRIAIGIENGRVAAGDLSAAEVQSYTHAVQQLEALGADAPPLHAAMIEYVAARALLPAGMTLPEAVRKLLVLRPRAAADLPPRDLVAKFLAAAGDRAHNPRYLRGLRADLGRFVAWLPASRTLGEITADEIQRYLRALSEGTMTDTWREITPDEPWKPIGPRRRDNIRDAIVALFRYAKTHGHLPEDRDTQAEKVPRLDAGHEIKFYTPEQICGFLVHVSDRWLPWFVLGAFAGIRSTEIVGDPEDPKRPRLRWTDFRWEKNQIIVPASAARKIKRPRRVPIRDNLREWLLPYRQASGYLYENGADQYEQTEVFERGPIIGHDEQGKAIRAAPLDWYNNGLRHSYGTHRNAELGNAGQLAEEMGTSIAMIRKHYDAVPADIEPEEYFGIFPGEGARIIQSGIRRTA